MDTREDIKKRIYEIEDRIRMAPDDTPPRKIYEWYAETDTLRDRLEGLPQDASDLEPDGSNVYSLSNADMEESADQTYRDDFVDTWNEDNDRPETWSQIVGTAK